MPYVLYDDAMLSPETADETIISQSSPNLAEATSERTERPELSCVALLFTS